jgi:hypothetical protein
MSKKILCNQIKPEFCESKYGTYCAITKTGKTAGDCRKINGGPILEGVDEKHLISYTKAVMPQRAPNVIPQRAPNVMPQRAPNVIPQRAPNVDLSVDTTVEDLNSVQFHFPEERDITEGSETASLLDVNKKQLVEISELITEKQFNDVFNTKYIQTYIELRKPLSKLNIRYIIRLIKTLYEQIQAIKNANFTKSKQADQIDKILSMAGLCKFIPGEKEQLLGYASDLGLSLTSNSNKNVICYVLLGAITADINYIITKMIEKEYFNPDKKGLPDKLSDLTPQEIAATLSADIKQMSGPVYGALLVPKAEFTRILGRNPPVFLLLGDIHVGNRHCDKCAPKGCLSLYRDNPTFYNYLSKLAKKTNLSIDLFLEEWTSQEERDKNVFLPKTNSTQDSALIESSDLMNPCTGQRKENELRKSCFFTEFRTHNANPRHSDISAGNKYNGDTILKFVYDFTRINRIQLMLGVRYPDFNVYEELLYLYSAKDNVETINLYFNSPFFKKYSRTLHEFYKLPDVIQAELMERLLNAAKNNEKESYMMANNIYSNIKTDMVAALKEFIGDSSESNQSKLQLIIEKALNVFGISFGSTLVDIYTISRALKGFKGGLPSQLSVVYQGNAHIQRQISLLQNYYDVVQTWDSPNAKDTKCIYSS